MLVNIFASNGQLKSCDVTDAKWSPRLRIETCIRFKTNIQPNIGEDFMSAVVKLLMSNVVLKNPSKGAEEFKLK